MNHKVKILVVDDHSLFRHCLSTILALNDEFEVVGEAENGQVALEMIEKLSPQIVLLDIEMPEMNGLEAAQMISQFYPQTKIIFLSMNIESFNLNYLLKLNAKGIVLKDKFAEEIKQCIEDSVNDKIFVSPDCQIPFWKQNLDNLIFKNRLFVF